MTNRDKYNAMSDSEFAQFFRDALCDMQTNNRCEHYAQFGVLQCDRCLCDYLAEVFDENK